MKPTIPSTFVLVLAFTIALPNAWAQKGTGDSSGVARQSVKPDVTTLRGEVVKVETGPCKTTSGRSLLGIHFVIETAKAKELTIHVGPADTVEFVAEQLKAGQKVKVEVFRTEKMLEGQYVAKTITIGDRTILLRDDTLRPVWAGSGRGDRGGFRGGFGRGRGRGWGQRGGYGGQQGWAGQGPGWCLGLATRDWIDQQSNKRAK